MFFSLCSFPSGCSSIARMTELSRTMYLKLLWDVEVSREYLISVSSFSRLHGEAGPLGDGNAPNTCIILEHRTLGMKIVCRKRGINTCTSVSLTKIMWPLRRPLLSWMQGCALCHLYTSLLVLWFWTCCPRCRAQRFPRPRSDNPKTIREHKL